MESAPTAPRADEPASRVRAVLSHGAHRIATVPPVRIMAPLVALQWLLALIVALDVGHHGSLWIVIPQVVVLLPLALVLVYAIALRLGGRLFAAWATVVWVALPYALRVYATPSLRTVYTHQFLPQLLGLSDDPRFAAMVAFAGAVYLTVRSLETGTAMHVGGALAAASAGSALAPREALVALGPAVGLALGRSRRRSLVAVLALGVLLGAVAAVVGGGLIDAPFARIGLADPKAVLGSLRENFWSGRVMEWLGVAGIAGALRGRLATGSILSVCFLAALLSVTRAPTLVVTNLGLLESLLPAWFAVTLLVAAIPLLVPHARTPSMPATVALRRFWDRIHAPTFAPRGKDDGYERPVATPLWATVSISALSLAILFIGMWNATRAPVYGGYDAQEHIDYAYNLIHHGRLPNQTQGGEFYTPPGFYAIAGVALWIGQLIGTHEPPHLALYLNAIYMLVTAGVLLTLARLLFPRRPVVWVASIGFFAFLPVVAKTEGMFYPETLNMLLSVAAVTLASWMLLRRKLSLRWLLLLGVVLGAGQLVRASAIFTFASIAATFVVAAATPRFRQRMPLRTVGIAIALVIALASPWYLRQVLKYHTLPHLAVSQYWTGVHHSSPARLPYFRFSKDDLFNQPVRPFFINEAFPVMYTEIWGDWFGYWAWSGYSAGPSPEGLAVLRQQTKVGILPTILAIVGWIGLWGIALRRRADGVALIPLLLLPLLAVGAVFWRAYATPTPDGNLVKASYALTSVPIWALGFGVAVDWLSRKRMLAVGLGVTLVVLAVLTLRFNLYGVRNHFIIF
jgi:4-amino-4-deoxy-L-arabinose transferase-like glycosyltransferase